MDTTAHDLKLLSIGYYIQGGIAGFYSLLAFGYLGFIATFIAKLPETKGELGSAIPPGIIPIISLVLGIGVLMAMAATACLIWTGYCLARRKNKTFVYVIAALSCLAIPYGTVLGIFTFMAMQRPAAQRMFQALPPAPSEPTQ